MTWTNPATSLVTSISGTANQISASTSVGAVTLSLTNGISIGSYQATSPPTGGALIPGQVSIGSATPSASSKLFVSTAANTEIWVDSPAGSIANQVWSKGGTSKWQMYVPASSNDLRLFDSADRFTFQSGGNFGIGTTSPTSALSVGATSQFQVNTVGVVVSGTWQGTVITGQFGGTGVANTGLTINLGSGAVGKYMASDGSGNATWATLSGAAVTSISGTANQINASASVGSVTLSLSSTIITPGTIAINGMTQGSVLFTGASSVVTQDNANFFWDDTNNTLGIGTTTTNATTNFLQVGKSTTATSNYIAIDGQNASDKGIQWYSSGTSRVFAIVPGGTPTMWSLTTGSQLIGCDLTNTRVMVGTGTAVNKLDVNGAMAIGTYAGVNTAPSNSLIVSGMVGVATTTFAATNPFLQLGSSAGTNSYLAFDAAANQDKAILFYSGGGGLFTVGVPLSQTYFSIRDFGSGSTRLKIDSSGQTSLNTLSAAANILEVNGSVAIGNAFLNTAGPSNGLIVSGQVAIGTSTAGTNVKLTVSDSNTGVNIRSTTTGASSSAAGSILGLFQDDGAACASGDRLGGIIIGGARDASNTLGNASAIFGFTTEAWSGTANGCYLSFQTTANTTTTRTERVRIDQNGTVGIGTSGSPSADSILNTSATSAYNHLIDGTQTAVDGSSYQNSLRIVNTFSPTNGSTLSTGIYCVPIISAPSTKTISFGCGAFISPTIDTNVGTISTYVGCYLSQISTTAAGTITSAYNLYVNQPLPLSNGNYYAASLQGGLVLFRSPASGDYTLTTANCILGVTSTAAARNINLPATAPDTGWLVIVKDESGGAAVNNITINRNGKLIDGAAANKVINTNYGVFRFYSDGTNYFTW